MKCPECNGTGKNKYGYNQPCTNCYGKGFVEPLTNKEYMQTCNTEELGCFICEKFCHGACGECRFCEKTELRHHCILGEWLKEKHNESV